MTCAEVKFSKPIVKFRYEKLLNSAIIFDVDTPCRECPKTATRKGLCHNCYQRGWAKANYTSPRRKQSRRRWKSENRERILWLSAKHRAKRAGLEFAIEISDIIIPNVCPVLGIKLVWAAGRDACPSVDRKNNDMGYTQGNIRVISLRANRIKSDGTLAELRAILQYMDS